MLALRAAAVCTASAHPGWRLAASPDIPTGRNAMNRRVLHPGAMTVRCLIVDDNPDFLRVARTLLEREGISVVGVAPNAAQALRSCRELKPDVALVDIDLGEESGFDVGRQLVGRESAELPRVILISAFSGDDFAEMIADSPAVSFLPKAGLSGAAIRVILARAGGTPAAGSQRDSR
jgi:CheY-like chemotaxis protein